MVAIKAQRAEAFVKAPDAGVSAILVYGPDAGMVSERARLVAQALAARAGESSEIIRIDDSDLDSDGDRLAIELHTVPMFGGAKVVRTTAGRRINAAMIKDLFAEGPPTAALVCEAGNLKPSDSMRKLFEGNDWAAALPCFSDDERDLARLVADMTAAAGLAIDRDAAELLVSRLGADRALSRGEIEKLLLYAANQTRISVDDVHQIVGDATDSGLEAIAMAAASGQPAEVVTAFDRAIAAGESAQAVVIVTLRYFQRLHRIAGELDAGRSIDEAVRTLRPPLHFKLRSTITAQSRLWSVAALTGALQRINETARLARLNSAMEDILAERLLFNLAAHAAQRRKR